MKTATVVAMVILAGTMYAQENTSERGYFANVSRYAQVSTVWAEQGYLGCLQSNNEGVMESALAHVAMMKLAVPAGEYKALKTKVAQIARTAATPEVRYKAFLTAKVLEQPEIFRSVAREGYGTADDFFAALASRLCLYSMAQ
jgi:hypothetical protein